MENPKPVKRLDYALKFGNLWLYILSLVKKRKMHAYTLDDEIEKKFGFRPNKIMIYVVLYKLEAEKLIESNFEERRKYYKLTKKGNSVLEQGRKMLGELKNKL